MSGAIRLDMKPDTEYRLGVVLGAKPYVLIQCSVPNEDEDALDIEVTTGGGVPQLPKELLAFLEDLADDLRRGIDAGTVTANGDSGARSG